MVEGVVAAFVSRTKLKKKMDVGMRGTGSGERRVEDHCWIH